MTLFSPLQNFKVFSDKLVSAGEILAHSFLGHCHLQDVVSKRMWKKLIFYLLYPHWSRVTWSYLGAKQNRKTQHMPKKTLPQALRDRNTGVS